MSDEVNEFENSTAPDTGILRQRKKIVEDFERLANNGKLKFVEEQEFGFLPLVMASAIDGWRALEHSNSAFQFDDGGGVTDLDVDTALQRSGVNVQTFSEAHKEVIRGANTAVRGALFEVETNQQLHNGSLIVPKGTASIQQQTFTNPGADFTFVGKDGHVIDSMNTKVAQSWDVIRDHYVHHPDVRLVYASSDAAQDAARHGLTVIDGHHGVIPLNGENVVVDVGTSSAHFQHQFEQHLKQIVDADHSHWFDHLDIGDFYKHIPWISLGVIGLRAGLRYRAGVDKAENMKQMGRDGARSLGGMTGAAIAHQVGASMPVAFFSALTSAAMVQGVFEVRDSWGLVARHEEHLGKTAEWLVRI